MILPYYLHCICIFCFIYRLWRWYFWSYFNFYIQGSKFDGNLTNLAKYLFLNWTPRSSWSSFFPSVCVTCHYFASFGPLSLMPQSAVRVRGKGSRRGRAKGVVDKPIHGQYKRWTEAMFPIPNFPSYVLKQCDPWQSWEEHWGSWRSTRPSTQR